MGQPGKAMKIERQQKKPSSGKLREGTWSYDFSRNKLIYLLFVPVAAYFIIFHYAPMFGLTMAFQDFRPSKGIFGSTWVGLQNFMDLFTGDTFFKVLRNTSVMALLNLTVGFAAPVIFAMLISEVRFKRVKRSTQIISYMPYFVSATVVTALAAEFLSSNGALTSVLSIFGLEKQNWLANPKIPVFWLINTFIEIWQGMGWGSIIYVAAIANVNGDLHEAAAIDGANRWTRMWKVTFPSISPLVVVMFIMRVGTVFKAGFDKILLLYMPTTFETADVLYTYTYRMAFGQTVNYGLSTASGMFQSVIALALLLFSNWLSKRVSGRGMI